MPTADEAQWRSYSKAIKIILHKRPLRMKVKAAFFRKRAPKTLKQKEKAYRKITRASYRRMYTKYPIIGYLNIMQQQPDFTDYSPTLRARIEKNREQQKLQAQEHEKKERQVLNQFLSIHPEAKKYLHQEISHEEREMMARVNIEELNRLKTLRPARSHFLKELIDELKYRYTAIRYYRAFSMKSKPG